MFWRKNKDSTIAPLGGDAEYSRLLEHEIAILFKHSPTCFISANANSQVEQFCNSNPDVPVYMVSVKKDRSLSDRIAESTGIEHASPQIIVFRKGIPTAVATHSEITIQRMNSMLEP